MIRGFRHRSRADSCSTDSNSTETSEAGAILSHPSTVSAPSGRAHNTTKTSLFCLPLELRVQIYLYLLQSISVSIGEYGFTVVHFYGHVDCWHTCSCHPKPIVPSNHWIFTSKQIFLEVRPLIYAKMTLYYQRRWDFLRALVADTIHETLAQMSAACQDATLFPQSIKVFAHVKKLRLNCAEPSDFAGRVTRSEAQRVTSSLLRAVRRTLPLLENLTLLVNDRSRISREDDCFFIPQTWFLEEVLAIKQLKSLQLHPEPDQVMIRSEVHYRRVRVKSGQWVRKDRCMEALSYVLTIHFAAKQDSDRLTHDNTTGDALQGRVLRRMYQHLLSNEVYRGGAYSFAVRTGIARSIID